jgi:hypothetical protein
MVQHVTGSVAVPAEIGIVAYSGRKAVGNRGWSTPGIALADRIMRTVALEVQMRAVQGSRCLDRCSLTSEVVPEK